IREGRRARSCADAFCSGSSEVRDDLSSHCIEHRRDMPRRKIRAPEGKEGKEKQAAIESLALLLARLRDHIRDLWAVDARVGFAAYAYAWTRTRRHNEDQESRRNKPRAARRVDVGSKSRDNAHQSESSSNDGNDGVGARQ